jgi:predicted ATPase
MLTHLTLINFALADHLVLDIEQGFNVLTGETGAGKSLLLDALSACLGERTDTNYVRYGAEKADITASFSYQPQSPESQWLKEHEMDEDTGEIHYAVSFLPQVAVKHGLMVVQAAYRNSKKLAVCWYNCIANIVSNSCLNHPTLSMVRSLS